jgi:large subunit ribosomal protein L15
MTVRKRRKKNRLRGHRVHGKGDTKNKRGAGSRGGRGKAGSHKHRFTKYYADFGKEKKQVRGKPRAKAVNLDEVEQSLPAWIASGKAQKSGDKIVVDGKKTGFGKLLGRGELHSRIVFENVAASKAAAMKLRKSGCVLKAIAEEEGKDEHS